MVNLIHIGDYKTGTSWWQNHVYPRHPGILYLDNPSERVDIITLLNALVLTRDLDFDAEYFRAQFAKVLRSIDCEDKKTVICREVLSGVYPTGDHVKRIAERLYEVFGDTKILIVIREQFSMLKAIYSQYVKIGGTLRFSEFIYDPVVSPGLIEKLKYHKIINSYESIFGQDNVFVGLFEEFKSDNELFVKRVFNFIGCADNWSLPEKDIVVNPSLKRVGLEIQRFVNRFLRNDFNPRKPLLPIDRIAAFFISQKNKQKLLDNTRNRLVYSLPGCDDTLVLRYAINFALTNRLSSFCERIQIGPKLAVPTQIVDELKGEFIASNELLRDKYGLPVDKFGWTL